MGRVAKYKKIKAFDPYSKQNGHGRDLAAKLETTGIWGLGDDGRKPKKRSRVSQKLREQKLSKKNKKKKQAAAAAGGGNLFDAPPDTDDEDDFDLNDLVGSLDRKQNAKKQKRNNNDDGVGGLGGTTVYRSTVRTVGSGTGKKKDEEQPEEDNAPAGATASGDDVDGATLSGRQATANPRHKEEDEELKVARMLRLDKQLEQKASASAASTVVGGRMEGESKGAYKRRVQAETRRIIKKETVAARNPDKKKRKIDFLESKRKRGKKGKAQPRGGGDSFENDGGGFDDDNHPAAETTPAERALQLRELETRVRFGEQAERPPEFQQVPRGASPSKKSNKNKFKKEAAAGPNNKKNNGNKKGAGTMDEGQIKAERDAMEAMRRKVQAQYAIVREQRKRDGTAAFHL